jgi:translation initiation factor IF-1
MVKNTIGGNKSKGFARKNLVKRDAALRVAKEEGEIYAQAVKIMGGSIASAIDINGNPLRAHIRGKFRGRGKRDNFIGPGTWLLVGLHDWQTTSKPEDIKDCDILEVYSDSDKDRLKNSITTINWSIFITNDCKTLSSTEDNVDDSGIEFADEATQEFEQLIAAQVSKGKNAVIMEDVDEIDVDEI